MAHLSKDDPPGIPGFGVQVPMAFHDEHALRQTRRARGCRLAEAVRALAPQTSPEKLQFPGYEDAQAEAIEEGVCLADIWRLASQAQFNIRLTTNLNARDHIQDEELMSHILDVKDPDHRKIILRQKCLRVGPGHYMYPEQCVHRCFDRKYRACTTHWLPSQLQNKLRHWDRALLGVFAAFWA